MKRQKRLTISSLFLSIALCLILVVACSQQPSPPKAFNIGITKIVSHPGIDDVEKGFMDTLRAYGKQKNVPVQFDQQNAQGDMNTSMLIANKLAANKVDLICAISTPSSQHALKATQTIPIIFGAVTDPVSAGIVQNPDKPGGNITGVSDVWPIKKQVELLLKLVPSVKTLGLVYNPGESNAKFMLTKLQEACDQLNIKLVTRSIANSGDVLMAAKSLGPKVNAFYSSIDNTVLSAVASLVKVAKEYKKPIIAGESDSVQKGAIATLGTNYYEIGVESGKLAIKVLQGAKPGEQPVISDSKTDLYLNMGSLNFLGIKVPEDLKNLAKTKFE